MYVVRRAFRNLGQMMAPGSIVEPAAIKRFKSRVAEGRIVEVNEHNFDMWREYFKLRMNVEIAATGGVPTEPVDLDDTCPEDILPEGQETEGQETEGQETEGQETEGQETEGQETEVQKPTVTVVVK